MKASRTSTIANIGAMAAMLVAVINLVTIRELSILIASAVVLVGLSVYSVMQRSKRARNQQDIK